MLSQFKAEMRRGEEGPSAIPSRGGVRCTSGITFGEERIERRRNATLVLQDPVERWTVTYDSMRVMGHVNAR